MTFENWFSSRFPGIGLPSAQAVLRLASEGATLPFIARYRKEQTGNLDEVGIQAVLDSKEQWDQVVKRQAHILGEIEGQGKLTPELRQRITTTFQLEVLEDIYLPFKQKKKTKASLAREAGLLPLADWIWNVGHGLEAPHPGQTLELWAFTFRNDEKGIADATAATSGAQDILVERLSEVAELRQQVRDMVLKKGFLRTQKAEKAKPNSKYAKYFDAAEPIPSLLQPQNSHRYLAIRRGWMEEELSLSITGGPQDPENAVFHGTLQGSFEAAACTVPDAPGASVLTTAAKIAFRAHVLPAMEREAHRALKDIADEIAIKVFAENVRKVLLASPFGPKGVLGVDPGLRTGCKLAVVDAAGNYVASHVIKLQSEEEKAQAKALLAELMKTAQVSSVAVGNGTAGRETESFFRATFKELGVTTPVVMVSEAGASVYSASETARDEFPQLDVTIRGAISIARRLQDPLAELVKIDPKSIGVGQYQHDVAPNSLKKSLSLVVDSCVNSVGVNLNTASYHLLAHVSGIGDALAKSVVNHRAEKGLFKSRQQLLEVPFFSTKTFEQAAGFLRVPESENPLDNTGVHPERYALLESAAQRHQKTVRDIVGSGVAALKADKQFEAEAGPFTFQDIVKELEKPGRDPRDVFVAFSFRDDVYAVKDLTPGMTLPGIVTNVTNFGAFVDVGVHQDGLVHLSQLSDRFVKDPREVVNPGDRVNVRVLEVNLEKNQISLTMKSQEPRRERPPREREARPPREARGPQGPRGDRPAGPTRANAGGGRPNGHGGPRPDRRPDSRGPRPDRGHGAHDARGPRPDRGGRPGGPPRAPRPTAPDLTHNPFAALAALKESAKKPKA